jgi:RNA polymerase sigma-B factor
MTVNTSCTAFGIPGSLPKEGRLVLQLTEPPTDAQTSQTAAASADPNRARLDRMLFARRAAGDERARDELIRRFLPLARSLARRYEQSVEPLDDLVQVASMGLVKAIDRYEPGRGCAFSSYAVPTIVGELKRHFRDRTWTVRPPRALQELTLRVDDASSRLSQRLDRAPTVSELAAEVGRSEEDVLDALQARTARGALSLHATVGGPDEEAELQDTVGASDEGYARAETRALLDSLLNGLTPRSRTVVRLRFEEDLTQAEIGALLGVSQMQISRIIRQALGRLRLVAAEHSVS